jgi:hypothetical protein
MGVSRSVVHCYPDSREQRLRQSVTCSNNNNPEFYQPKHGNSAVHCILDSEFSWRLPILMRNNLFRVQTDTHETLQIHIVACMNGI